MKGIKVGFGVLGLAIFISWFSIGTAYAQVGFDVWEGKWLKVGTNFKGYERNLAGPPDWFTVNDRFTLFLYMGDPGSWDGSGFAATFYYFDDIAGWQSVPVTLNYLHGTPLDLLIWVENDIGNITTGDGERLAFVARLSGKLARTTPTLQTASFKCLGGFFIEIDTSDPFDPIYAASGVTMTGGLVPATFCNSTTNQQYPPCWRPN